MCNASARPRSTHFFFTGAGEKEHRSLARTLSGSNANARNARMWFFWILHAADGHDGELIGLEPKSLPRGRPVFGGLRQGQAVGNQHELLPRKALALDERGTLFAEKRDDARGHAMEYPIGDALERRSPEIAGIVFGMNDELGAGEECRDPAPVFADVRMRVNDVGLAPPYLADEPADEEPVAPVFAPRVKNVNGSASRALCGGS